ncbi:MAG: hypothetical protein ABUS54_13435 [Actinomycetota bacterium]
MSTRTRTLAAAGSIWVVAMVVGLIAGGFVWIAIVGAVVMAALSTAFRGGPASGGRQRNRNRNRNRDRSS